MAYLSLARIKKLVHTGKGIHVCTCPGDGLASLGSFQALLIPGKHGPDRPPSDGRLDAVPADAWHAQVQRTSPVQSGRCRISIVANPPYPDNHAKQRAKEPVQGLSAAPQTEGIDGAGSEGSQDSEAHGTMDFGGYWLFVDEAILDSDSGRDIYVFQLLQYSCLDRGGAEGMKITGYSETGAHGLLEVEWQGRIILVPLSPEHVLIDQENATVTFTDLRSLDPSDD